MQNVLPLLRCRASSFLLGNYTLTHDDARQLVQEIDALSRQVDEQRKALQEYRELQARLDAMPSWMRREMGIE